ncbi:MAG: hypothetical protein HKM24_05855 [Gammaproteobacteria bacterium]|nr:hypothetical protein [Gammaproteobacteria bacterium]
MSREIIFKTLVEGLIPDVYAFAYWLSVDKHKTKDLTHAGLCYFRSQLVAQLVFEGPKGRTDSMHTSSQSMTKVARSLSDRVS